ncbi:MAG: hypothetical protein ACKOCL_00785 [Candidatus Nanopelagicaceae bacterium]
MNVTTFYTIISALDSMMLSSFASSSSSSTIAIRNASPPSGGAGAFANDPARTSYKLTISPEMIEKLAEPKFLSTALVDFMVQQTMKEVLLEKPDVIIGSSLSIRFFEQAIERTKNKPSSASAPPDDATKKVVTSTSTKEKSQIKKNNKNKKDHKKNSSAKNSKGGKQKKTEEVQEEEEEEEDCRDESGGRSNNKNAKEEENEVQEVDGGEMEEVDAERSVNRFRQSFGYYGRQRFRFLAASCSVGHFFVVDVTFDVTSDNIFQNVTLYDSLRRTSRGQRSKPATTSTTTTSGAPPVVIHTQGARLLRLLQQFLYHFCCADNTKRKKLEKSDLILENVTLAPCPEQDMTKNDCALFAYAMLVHLVHDIAINEHVFDQQDVSKFRKAL